MELTHFKELLAQKNDLLVEILELTVKQPDLMNSEEKGDELMRNVAQRQKLIDKLEEAHGLVPDVEALRGDPECVCLAQQTKTLLSKISAQDTDNERVALERLASLRRQMRKNREGQTGLRGYEQVGDVGALYFNRVK